MLSLCTTFALLLSYIESLIPLSLAVPGIKMGLANAAILFVLYKMGTKEAFIVSLFFIVVFPITQYSKKQKELTRAEREQIKFLEQDM